MSRCYPYPPPGYARRVNVELGLSPKKERPKRKERKKKRRKDSESKGDLPLDLGKRSKKTQQTGFCKDVSLANGSIPERTAFSSEAVHEKVARRRVRALTSNEEMPSAGMLAINCNGIPTISKQGSRLPLIPVQAICNSNGAVVHEAAPSTSTHSKSEVELKKESHTRYIPRVEGVWSTLDDQEWLFHHNNLRQSVTRNKSDEEPSPQAWAEAVLLPSVGIYALPMTFLLAEVSILKMKRRLKAQNASCLYSSCGDKTEPDATKYYRATAICLFGVKYGELYEADSNLCERGFIQDCGSVEQIRQSAMHVNQLKERGIAASTVQMRSFSSRFPTTEAVLCLLILLCIIILGVMWLSKIPSMEFVLLFLSTNKSFGRELLVLFCLHWTSPLLCTKAFERCASFRGGFVLHVVTDCKQKTTDGEALMRERLC